MDDDSQSKSSTETKDSGKPEPDDQSEDKRRKRKVGFTSRLGIWQFGMQTRLHNEADADNLVLKLPGIQIA